MGLQAVVVVLLQVVMVLTGVAGQGFYEVVVPNAGIATMHAAVTHIGSVVLLDRTNVGVSQLNLPSGVCRDNPEDRVMYSKFSSFSVIPTQFSTRVVSTLSM